jgi:nitroreductase
MEVYEAITRRRAIRRFQDKPVPYDVLEKCVNAGRLAPSSRNRQVLEYIIIDDKELLPRVFDNVRVWGEDTKESPELSKIPKAYIIILVNSALEAEFHAPRRSTYDVGFAAENILLLALEQGLGACPALLFNEKKLKQIFNVPAGYNIGVVVAMGYPDESPVTEVSTGSIQTWVDDQGVRHVPKRKLEDITHRNKFA